MIASASYSIRSAYRRLRRLPAFNRVAVPFGRVLVRLGVSPRSLADHLPPIGLVKTGLPNGQTLVLESHGDDWPTSHAFWLGWTAHEPETAALFFQLALLSRTVIDVGSFVGYFALLAAHANPLATVIAIEPVPAIAGRLRHNVTLNGVRNVLVYECAAGRSVGMTSIYHSASAITAKSSLSPDYVSRAHSHSGIGETHVAVRPIDAIVAELGLANVDLVKIDTETTEADVIDGMTATLSSDRPVVICEVLPGSDTVRLGRTLASVGYRTLRIRDGKLEISRELEGGSASHNFVFVHRSGPNFDWPFTVPLDI